MAEGQFADREELLRTVYNDECRRYLKEAIDCYEVAAYRASLVMLCCAVFENVRLTAADYAPFDRWAEKVTKLVDAKLAKQGSWESNVLENVESARHMFKPAQVACLKKILEARNRAAHPSQIDTDQWEVHSLIRSGHANFLSQRALLGDKGVMVLLEQLEKVEMFSEGGDSIDAGAERLLSMLDSAAFIYLVGEVAARLVDCSERYRRNAGGLTRLIARRRNLHSRKALYLKLLHERTLDNSEPWLLDLIHDDPAILLEAKDSRKRVDVLIASICAEVDELDRVRIFFLADLFARLAGTLEPETFVKDFGGTFDALLSKVWWHPAVLRSMSAGDPVRALIANTMAEKLEAAAEAGRFIRLVLHTRSEELLATGLTGAEALTMLARLCDAGFTDATCARLRDEEFLALPDLRDKAIESVCSSPDEAEAIIESNAPHARAAGSLDFLFTGRMAAA
ncbi:hypothetical protein GOE06_14575 [Sinorhizobium medicae]|nr:hypothetical protein [Sinorhizobium meliloti]MDX0964803.1 hypothetical protein [Sinorhizobium medicae]